MTTFRQTVTTLTSGWVFCAALAAATALAADLDHPTGDFLVDTAQREQTRNFFNTVFLASQNVEPGATGTVAGCVAGDTSADFKDATLRRINYFRAMAGVPAGVDFDAGLNAKAQQAALIMLANSTLNHNPPANSTCFSAGGAEGAANSNLSIGNAGPAAVASQMFDDGFGNQAVGHRRWLLYPQTQTMGTGDILDSAAQFRAANAIWIIEPSTINGPRPAVNGSTEGFVAWPPRGYFPVTLLPSRWSLSLPRADFANARIGMKQGSTTIMSNASLPTACTYNDQRQATNSNCREALVTNVGENTLVWKPTLDLSAFAAPNAADQTYTIEISDVKVNNATVGPFSYEVTLFDPTTLGDDSVLPEVSGGTARVGQAATFQHSTVPDAFGSQFRRAYLNAKPFVEGADGSNANYDAVTSDDYALTVKFFHKTGRLGFRLLHSKSAVQSVTLKPEFLVAPGGKLEFQSWLAFAGNGEVARVQVSANDGQTWADVYNKRGNITKADLDASGGLLSKLPKPDDRFFKKREVDLSAYAGRLIRVRFVYEFDGTADGQVVANVNPLTQTGWYFDGIKLTGVERLEASEIGEVGQNREFAVTPDRTGEFVLQARAEFFGAFPALDWGPLFRSLALPAVDEAPRPFKFQNKRNAAQNVLVLSNKVAPRGLLDGAVVTIGGGEYAINDGAFRTTPGFVRKGDRVQVRVLSAASPATAVTATLSIGGVTGTFSATTRR